MSIHLILSHRVLAKLFVGHSIIRSTSALPIQTQAYMQRTRPPSTQVEQKLRQVVSSIVNGHLPRQVANLLCLIHPLHSMDPNMGINRALGSLPTVRLQYQAFRVKIALEVN